MGEQTRVLIVCDDEGMTQDLRVILQKSGYVVACTPNTTEGLTLLTNALSFDVTIMVCNSPGMDCFSFLDEVRKRNLNNTTRVFIASPNGRCPRKRECLLVRRGRVHPYPIRSERFGSEGRNAGEFATVHQRITEQRGTFSQPGRKFARHCIHPGCVSRSRRPGRTHEE